MEYLQYKKHEEKIKLSDFEFFYFEEDEIYNKELERKGVKLTPIKLKIFKETQKKSFLNLFKFKFDSGEIGLSIIKELIKNKDNLEELKNVSNKNFILGFDFFKTEFFNDFKFRKDIYERIKDDWSCFAKRCDWQYVCLIKYEDKIFFISSEIETRFQYPLNEKNKDIFQSIVMPNSIRHFVHLNEMDEDEIINQTPKKECFKKIENYFYNNFYNCQCLKFKF